MIEGETMSDIIRRTKKCCVKMFRKMSLNSLSSRNSNNQQRLSLTNFNYVRDDWYKKQLTSPEKVKNTQNLASNHDFNKNSLNKFQVPSDIISKSENNVELNNINNQTKKQFETYRKHNNVKFGNEFLENDCNTINSKKIETTNFICTKNFCDKSNEKHNHKLQTRNQKKINYSSEWQAFNTVIPFEAVNNTFNHQGIEFEKVKYDDTKRYFRNSPFNSLTCSTQSSPISVNFNRKNIEISSSPKSIFSLDDDYPSMKEENYDSGYIKSLREQNTLYDLKDIRIDENYNVSSPYRMGTTYEIQDNKMNTRQNKRFIRWQQFDQGLCSSISSSTTVETWLDDETFDNSFNEELERRCVLLRA